MELKTRGDGGDGEQWSGVRVLTGVNEPGS